MLPALEPSPDFCVTSVNDNPVSLRNNLVPPPSEFTNKSKSPSPSTSAKAAAVESCPSQPTLASLVISTNFQPPRFRYNLFSLSSPQKYKSHHPSLSISPAATPEPLSRFLFRMDRSLSSRLRKSIPVESDSRRLNPGVPKDGTVNLAAAHELSGCSSAAKPLLSPIKRTTKTRQRKSHQADRFIFRPPKLEFSE